MKWGLSDDPDFELPVASSLPAMYPELEQLGAFGGVERWRFEIPMHHSTDSYVGWLSTDSLVNGLDETSRPRFLADIGRLVRTKYHGTVVRNFSYDIVVARTRGEHRREREDARRPPGPMVETGTGDGDARASR